MPTSHIRNFSIIAHIDHGKSTLADRLIEQCGTGDKRNIKDQALDTMDIERERGITIKSQTVRLSYTAQDGRTYQLNLMDTPGHVDFSYEVSRALAACEGSVLVVDATQGVEAQTLANTYLAVDNNHEIIPVLNKVDLPAADPSRIFQQIEDIIGLDTQKALCVSAKTGQGIHALLEAIIHDLPPPQGNASKPLKALLVDSWYDAYLGVIVLIRVEDGIIAPKTPLRMMATKGLYTVETVGIFTPQKCPQKQLGPGEIGYIIAGIKNIKDCRIGDTITSATHPTDTAYPGFQPSVPVVFCSLFPVDTNDFEGLRESLAKLCLNDASVAFEPTHSPALGMGFRCGFLGLLHLEVTQQRLEREFDLNLLTTAPSVVYNIRPKSGEPFLLHNPADLPESCFIEAIEEPWIEATIFAPDIYIGPLLNLCTKRRGVQVNLTYVNNRAMIVYRLPLSEVVFDFYDRLKSLSQGHASFDYQIKSYEADDLVKITLMVNGDTVDSLSFIAHRSQAQSRGRALCARLKDLIPRQLFKIAIQAAIGGKIIARETISALRKDVTAKCYGGDITRKRKLLEKQKEGKKRMRQIGNIEIPSFVFLEALKTPPKD